MFAQIEVNTHCNFRCWFCQNAHYEIAPKKIMSMELFENILDALSNKYGKKLSLISFATYNEPLLDPFFKDRLRMLTKKGFRYWWLSNGSGMNSDIVDFLLTEKLNITPLLFNLCSCDPETLASSVGISRRAATEYLDTFLDSVTRLAGWNNTISVKVHGDFKPEHQKRIKEMKDWLSPLPVHVWGTGVMDRAGMLPGVGQAFHHATSAKLLCTSHNLSNIYIGVSGEVFLCCHDYYKKTSYRNILDPEGDTSGRKQSLKILHDSFCTKCEFALDMKTRPVEAVRLLARSYVSQLPTPIKSAVRRGVRFVRRLEL